MGIEDWERVRENVAGNGLLRSSSAVLDSLNAILREKEIEPIVLGEAKPKSSSDDEIPF